jgi:DNA-directed RNA polymerase subunit RPC12/RpoP
MSAVMVDYRCPYCDSPVVGEHGIVHRLRKPRATTCQVCSRPVVVKWDDEDRLPEMHSWYFDTPPHKRAAAKKKSKRSQRRAGRSAFLVNGDWSTRRRA